MTALRPGHQWAGGCGLRAQRRYLLQRWRLVERLWDEASVAARARLYLAVADEPDPAHARLHLAHVAWMAMEQLWRDGVRECTWAMSMNHMLDKFDERARAEAE